MLGHTEGLWKATWPSLIKEQLEFSMDEEVEIPIQVNGRVRDRIRVAAGSPEDGVIRLALARPSISQHVDGKEIVKKVFVPDKLLNLVVK